MTDHTLTDIDRSILRCLDGCYRTAGQIAIATTKTVPESVCCALALRPLYDAGYIETIEFGEGLLHTLTDKGREWVAADNAERDRKQAREAVDVASLRAQFDAAVLVLDRLASPCYAPGCNVDREQMGCNADAPTTADSDWSCAANDDDSVRTTADCWRMYLALLANDKQQEAQPCQS